MKILVTGGAGFIGSNIVKRLVDLVHEPVVYDNLSSGYCQNLLPQVPFIEADLRNLELLVEAAQGCGVILHLAASVGNKRSIDLPQVDSEINLIGTLNVLEAARYLGINRVVFSSSAGIFGELKTLPIAEGHPQDPDSPYGTSKLAAEKMCLVYNKLYGMRNICLRYFNVFGPHQRFDAYGNVIPIFANRLLRKEPIHIFGDGEQTRDFVNVRDVVSANLKAAFSEEVQGVFNIGSGARISINQLAQMMQKAAGLTADIEYLPPRPGDVRDSLADISKAQKLLGYDPGTDIYSDLVDYWNWIKNDPLSN
ncbi:MAG: NAD-dependent epimerase/dehydratase family protein [Anaerolineaceae bacterium]|nr:NAD-dependent epimerase/dehydratase family protein [Anaerolineaceae bacterium]